MHKKLELWRMIGTIDIGEESGICDRCGKTLRYGVKFKRGDKIIIVGRECADKLHGSYCSKCNHHCMSSNSYITKCAICGGELKVEEITY